MIQTATRRAEDDKRFRHIFRVTTAPTTATLRYDKYDVEGDVIENVVETYPLESLGDGRYGFSCFILAQKYTIELNTEATIKEFEGDSSLSGYGEDKPLLYTWTSNLLIYLPPCDSNRMAVQLYNPDGTELECRGGQRGIDRKYWSKRGNAWRTVDGQNRLYYVYEIFPQWFREPGSDWQEFNPRAAVYVRVTDVTEILSSPLMKALTTEYYAYNYWTWRTNEKDKEERKLVAATYGVLAENPNYG